MKFRCKQSGNIVEFTEPHDIEQMKKEQHYEVVEEEKKEKAKKAVNEEVH